MMEIVEYPQESMFMRLSERPSDIHNEILETVQRIIERVQEEGDQALVDLTQKFDSVSLAQVKVPATALSQAREQLSSELISAIDTARENIEAFHSSQLRAEAKSEPRAGIVCWEQRQALDPVGLYIPAGSAPLISSALMLLIPARIAGCKQVVLCAPPDRSGVVHPAILFLAAMFDVTEVFSVGGAQAIAAMAFGTQSVPRVRKIFGPGNRYVTLAKQMLSERGQVAIDMPAGPSELVAWCDEAANPRFLAADLLSQAEHGADSQVILVTESLRIANAVQAEVARQLETLPRKEIAKRSLEHSKILLLNDVQASLRFVDVYGPEHLIIAREDAEHVVREVRSAGSIFLGNFTPESAGDYASGTNHVLPTAGYAKFTSGVSVDSFMKSTSVQRLTAEGLDSLRSTITTLARAEGLEAHA
ncbi:MAG: histidinol dehydrogenase, partial [Bdellovibrionales bacterium]|nr:histidinol dehydrogenase [Bdellovibrionales bacterium]